MRRGVLFFAVALVLLAALPARADDLGAAVNAVRSPDLSVDGTVDGFAQAAANRIANGQSLVHSNLNPLLSTCSAAGEVIGWGPDIGTVMGAFANSSTHWNVIQGSKWNAMGTGLASDSSGKLWVAVVFCTLPVAAPPPPPPPPPAPAPAPATPAPAPRPAPAPAPAPAPPPPAPEPDPALRLATIFRYGPVMSIDGSVSLLLGASPFLPPADWWVISTPSVS